MNIDINTLKKQSQSLEKEYEEIEQKICNYILSNKEHKEEIKKLEKREKLIDKKISVLDKLINYLTKIPKLYSEYESYDNELKRIEGEQ